MHAALSDRISSALHSSPHVPAKRVQVEHERGNIVLKGSVDSFYQKQMAQESLRRVDGVKRIQNMLEVNWA